MPNLCRLQEGVIKGLVLQLCLEDGIAFHYADMGADVLDRGNNMITAGDKIYT